MAERKVPAARRDRRIAAVHVGHPLAIALAARDAHGSQCRVNGFDCGLCRMYAELIAQATRPAHLDEFPKASTEPADELD